MHLSTTEELTSIPGVRILTTHPEVDYKESPVDQEIAISCPDIKNRRPHREIRSNWDKQGIDVSFIKPLGGINGTDITKDLVVVGSPNGAKLPKKVHIFTHGQCKRERWALVQDRPRVAEQIYGISHRNFPTPDEFEEEFQRRLHAGTLVYNQVADLKASIYRLTEIKLTILKSFQIPVVGYFIGKTETVELELPLL